MKLSCFHVGLHLSLKNVPYRIDRILTTGECYLERLSDRALIVKNKSALIDDLTMGFIQITGKAPHSKEENFKDRVEVDISAFTSEQQRIMLRRFEYIKNSIKILGERPTKNNMEIVIERTAQVLEDKNPPSCFSVCRWWKKWLASDKNLISLADKKSGSNATRCFGKIVSEEIQIIIQDVYLTKQRFTKQAVFDALCHRMNELNTARLNPLRFPSRAQFYRILDKVDKYDVLTARHGKHVADKHFRTSGAGVVVNHILERVEVDHTPLDVIVVNEKTGLPDGRPTLTLLLDRYSRMPLGFEIGFEPPSELSVMRALRNSILSKNYIKKMYPDIENYWPAYGIPNTLVCDNGLEFHSHQLRRMCAELNIELQFCPKKQPQYKGAIERFLGTLNRAVCHSLPGTTFSNIQQRGQYDAPNSAKISLCTLKDLIHQWIIDIYCQRTHRITNRTPLALWNDGLQMIEPILPESLAQLDLILTREIKRKLTHQGVQLFGLFYNSSELSILRIRSVSTYEVTVRYDPENIGSVNVYDELNGDYIKVDCITAEYSNGLTLRQHRQIFKDAKQCGQLEQDENTLLTSKARFHKKIEDLSRNKLLRERKKAARDAISSTIKTSVWKSNPDLELSAKPLVEDLIQPMSFTVVTRGRNANE